MVKLLEKANAQLALLEGLLLLIRTTHAVLKC
jgi:hypothetical protein